MCRIIVSLLYIKVLISGSLCDKRISKAKVVVFRRISASLDTGIGFDLYDTDLVQKLFNTRDFGANFEIEKVLFLHMHIELEQLHVCHAYIKPAQIEEFSSRGGGVQPSENFLTSQKKPDKMGDGGRFSICSALVWLKFNLAIELLSRQ